MKLKELLERYPEAKAEYDLQLVDSQVKNRWSAG